MQNYLLVLLVLTSKVLANPIDVSPTEITSRDTTILSGEEGILERNAAETIAPLKFSGPITPGGSDVKLLGKAKDIYEQILVLNPTYDVFDFPSCAAGLEADGVTRENIGDTSSVVSSNDAVTARNVLKPPDGINCDIRTYAFYPDCYEGLEYLRRLGQAWCGAPAKSCARVSCSWDCGMYFCSKMTKEKRVRCNSIANDIPKIRSKCCRKSQIGLIFAGGRIAFSSHNVELGNANC